MNLHVGRPFCCLIGPLQTIIKFHWPWNAVVHRVKSLVNFCNDIWNLQFVIQYFLIRNFWFVICTSEFMICKLQINGCTLQSGLHNSFHLTIRDGRMCSKFGARGEHGDVFLFSNLGALWFSENRTPVLGASLHLLMFK